MRRFLLVFFFAVTGSVVYATDHNEPDLLNSFYRDRNGSGADIYHVFAYPDKTGENLNLVLTLAPVPDTGQFEPESVQRIYLRPSVPSPVRDSGARLKELAQVGKEKRNLVKFARGFERGFLGPIIQNAKDIFAGQEAVNNLPINQTTYPEILITYNGNGLKAKICFRNFNFKPATENECVVARSNGKETDPAKLEFAHHKGIKVFVGGRDDAFFNDIGGFFRSINWASALDKDREFIWEGLADAPSYLDGPEAKETHSRVKGLIEKNSSGEAVYGADVVFSAKDIREWNNVNTLSFQIPLSLIVKNRAKEKLIRIWAESFLTDQAYAEINRQGAK